MCTSARSERHIEPKIAQPLDDAAIKRRRIIAVDPAEQLQRAVSSPVLELVPGHVDAVVEALHEVAGAKGKVMRMGREFSGISSRRATRRIGAPLSGSSRASEGMNAARNAADCAMRALADFFDVARIAGVDLPRGSITVER